MPDIDTAFVQCPYCGEDIEIVVALLSMRQHGRVLRALGGDREAAYDFRPGLWLNALVGLLGVGLSAYLVVGYV